MATTNWAEQITIARTIATIAHRSQTDKAGIAYLSHPARVAAAVAARLGALGADPHDIARAEAVAWLHDVVEDTDITRDDLHDAGIGWAVISDVERLTRVPHQTAGDYYEGIRVSPIALHVKEADVDDNSDPARLALLDSSTATRLAEKYTKARALLGLTGSDLVAFRMISIPVPDGQDILAVATIALDDAGKYQLHIANVDDAALTLTTDSQAHALRILATVVEAEAIATPVTRERVPWHA